ncbi:MAG: hypothetical protein Q8K45_07585 [Rubrivivax sp.]|nr:hypothetical protein [Rubrivivax sp.]
MTERADTDHMAPLPWRLMVLALAGALTPPEPVRLGPVLRHRGVVLGPLAGPARGPLPSRTVVRPMSAPTTPHRTSSTHHRRHAVKTFLNALHMLLYGYMARSGLLLHCSDAPNTDGMNAAAVMSAQLGQEALDWYKAKDAEAKPLRDAAGAKAIEVADQQLASSKANDALAADYANYNKTTFRPLEQGIVADAAAFDTPERRQAAADEAMAGVNSGAAAMRSARARALAASGINPGSVRSMAALDGQDVEQASALSSASFNARKGVETTGFARKMDAASLGRGLASSQATSAGLALTAGNNAVGNAQAPVTMANQGTATHGAGFNTAIQGQGQAGGLYGQSAQIASKDNGMWGALGGIAGQFAGSRDGSKLIADGISALSDVNMKADIRPEDPERALQEVVSTPVSNFKYDPAKLAAQGIPQSEVNPGESTGPMAQDVAANMGEDAAPGGKRLNLVTMNGKTMAAIQALDKKVNRLAEMISSGRLEVSAA